MRVTCVSWEQQRSQSWFSGDHEDGDSRVYLGAAWKRAEELSQAQCQGWCLRGAKKVESFAQEGDDLGKSRIAGRRPSEALLNM